MNWRKVVCFFVGHDVVERQRLIQAVRVECVYCSGEYAVHPFEGAIPWTPEVAKFYQDHWALMKRARERLSADVRSQAKEKS